LVRKSFRRNRMRNAGGTAVMRRLAARKSPSMPSPPLTNAPRPRRTEQELVSYFDR
jgi:hypothetical protein